MSKEGTPPEGFNKYVETSLAFVVHPNVLQAYLEYDGDAHKFATTIRTLKERDGHQEDHDPEFRENAERKSMNHLMAGNPWPKGKNK